MGTRTLGGGTRLTLWTNIDRRFISMGAARWHICIDVLDRLLSGTPVGRIAGGEAMKFEGWRRLNAEYARQFGIEAHDWPPQAARGQVNDAVLPINGDTLVMKETTKRSIVRWIHIVFSIPILGYIYSPFEEIPKYAARVRFVVVPVMLLSGLWMWKGHVLRRLISNTSP